LRPWRAHEIVMADLQATNKEFRLETSDNFNADGGTGKPSQERFNSTEGDSR
jgi:hypothetical protein